VRETNKILVKKSLGGDKKTISKQRMLASILDIALLGPIEVICHGNALEITGKLAGFFALVATAPGASVTRDWLATMLWGNKDTERANHNLRQLLSRLRKMACSEIFTITDTRIGLLKERVNCDLWSFRTAKDATDRHVLRSIASLHRGAFCEGLDLREESFDEWLAEQSSLHQSQMANVCVRLGGLELDEGCHDVAIALAKQAVAVDEFREDGHRLLMQALVAADRRSEAIRHYDILYAFLEREIDCEPDKLTQALVVSLKQETHVSKNTAPVTRLTTANADWMQRLAESALDQNAPAILVIQHDGQSFEQNSKILAAQINQITQRHATTLVQTTSSEIVFQSTSVKHAVKAGLEFLRVSLTDARMGVHVANIESAKDDSLLNTRQLCRLAKSGELLLSLDAREQLQTSHDIAMTDLGNIKDSLLPASVETIRAYSVEEQGDVQTRITPMMRSSVLPLIAVIPFTTFASDPSHQFLGELLADEMITVLSRCADTRLISRLTTTALASKREPAVDDLKMLGAAYAASGTCYVMGDRIRLTLEFSELETSQIVFLETLSFNLSDALNGNGHIDELAGRMIARVMNTELRRASSLPFSNLANSTLMLGAVTMMHQLSHQRFETSREMLEVLTERDKKHPAPHSWLAMYRLLRVSQGWSDDPEKDAVLASDSSQRALDLDPYNSLALAVDGHIQTQFHKNLSRAEERFTTALESNPSNGIGWLFKSTMHAFNGEGILALQAAENASRLSPLDPRRWFYDSLAATAAVGASQYKDAIFLAKRSIKTNATHTSTYRALAIAQSLSGQMDDARETVQKILSMQPGLTATDYRKRHPVGDGPVGKGWANALHEAGLPL
jgi:adenylate cyclase